MLSLAKNWQKAKVTPFLGYTRREKHGFTKKLTAEEKAAKIAAMQGNAAEHDVKRKARVTKGREEDEKEEQLNKKDDHSYFR